MWNGWKKAAIGLSALLAFVVLELVAVIGGVAVFLGLVMDVDLPFFRRGIAGGARTPNPAACRRGWSMRRPRQNASAMHTSTSSRSNGRDGGLSGSILALSRFNS
jgi:hypothetical protein